AERFGLETAMTVDARRAGARMVEVEVGMDHRHRGRSMAGFGHRARQGADIVRALWPRLTSSGQRVAAIVTVFAVMAAAAVWAGGRSEHSSVGLAAKPAKVVLFGVPGLSVDDLGTGTMPNLDGLVRGGAVAATTVRTLSDHPSTVEGYATLGAGSRAWAGGEAVVAEARAADAGVSGSGRGRVVVPEAARTIALNERRSVSSTPGALGDALRGAGLRTGLVSANAGGGSPSSPGAIALMGSDGSVDVGHLGGDLADPGALGREVAAVLDEAHVVLVDAAGTDQAPAPALAAADRALGQVAGLAGPDVLLLVVSVSPPGQDWRLTPMVASGRGVTQGRLHSPSTRRPGLVTLTDVAPTVLQALGAEIPGAMVGHALRYRPGGTGLLRDLDRDASLREDLYSRVVYGYIAFQAVVYLLAILARRLGWMERAGATLRVLVLAFAAWPLATFAAWAVPGITRLGGGLIVLLLGIDALVVAAAVRARGHPLSPLTWICGATVALLVVDVATGARLQLSSFLGYSGPYTAGRFSGLGNAAFAALASSTIVIAAVHVHRAPRRREALVTAGALLALVALVDGAPSLGADVGGILTLVPVFGLTFLALAGRRLSWLTVLGGAAVTVAGVAVATGVDMLRPPDARTHLGRLVGRIQDEGLEPLLTTLARKAEGSLRTFDSPWSWAIPVIFLYGLYVLLRARGLPGPLADRSALRVGAIAMVSTGLLGCLLNDSGVAVTAVVFVYIAPFLTLLILHRPVEPVLLEPASTRPTDPAAGAATGTVLLGR
ncbi:MAG: hypothetical protein M3378_02015, partial [Actinomycetota bacterium]|nr:hypothetical protein [Actinomycetota bacterium]